MNWCFAVVNNKLAEVYFKKNNSGTTFIGHAYVKKGDFDKRERKMIETDITKYRFSYYRNKYRDQLTGKVFYREDMDRVDFNESSN